MNQISASGPIAVVWALTTTASGTGMGTFITQSADFSVEDEMVEIKGSTGEVVCQIHYNQKQLLTMEVIPSSTTLALAKAANILPVPGAIITVADTDDTEVAGTNSGKYVFIKGSKKKSNTGETRLTFEMMQYVNSDITNPVS